MASNNSINLVDLDFESLKISLKNYLRNQAQFKDYDFEGSNINVLLDLLSYNTYKNAFYINMAISEAFIDSAQLKDSVLSHSKELNYVPRSARSSKAKVKVSFTVDTPENQPYLIEKGKMFTSLVKNTSYSFAVPETITVASANNTFEFETDIYEGIYIQDSYVYNDNVENQRFRLTNKNCDTTSLVVNITEDNKLIGKTYRLATTLLDLNEFSEVYFLQASENGYYEIIFGDSIVGKKPKHSSLITLEYRITEASLANSAREFACAFDPTNGLDEFDNLEVTTMQVSTGGADPEDIESIRYYAPRHFQVQERTITPTDYEISLKTQFPEINAVSVFGGEILSPPQFGKVFVSLDIANVDGLPESKKDEYLTFLRRRAPLSINPVFITPEYLYVYIDSIIKYDVGLTKLTPERIKTLVRNTISTYNINYLNDFNATLRYSRLVSEIDNSEVSILSNLTDIKVYKKITPTLNEYQNIDINFNIALRDDIAPLSNVHDITDYHVIESTPFTYSGTPCILEDDGNGIIRIMKFEKSKVSKIVNIGTINYDTGFMQLKNFNVSNYQNEAIKIYAVPRNSDIGTSKNTILTIEPAGIDITIQTQN